MHFRDWFLRWLDLVGECEQASGRMIDDDMKAAVMLKRSPKKLRDHFVLESPQLANVENKFPVLRELIQHWCRSRRILSSKKPPLEIAAVSATVGDSGAVFSLSGSVCLMCDVSQCCAVCPFDLCQTLSQMLWQIS